MYLRTIQRRNKDGSVVRYMQLAHNVRHPDSGNPVAEVIHSFGREDQLDRDALGRLVRSIARYLGPGAELAATAAGGDGAAPLLFVSSKAMGGGWALDGLWRRVGIHEVLFNLLAGRRLDPRAERVLFALVANRALEPLSKLAATRWVGERAALPGLDSVDDDACYRAMDWLVEIEEELAEAVYFAVADLLNLEVDLLFFDTTSTYFEIEAADDPAEGEMVGFRTLRPLQGPPPRSAPGGDRHGRDPHWDPHPGVVLARQHQRSGVDPPGQGRPAGLEAGHGWCGSPTGGSPRPRTAATCSAPAGTTSSARSCAGQPKRPPPHSPAKGRYHPVAGNLRVKEVVIDDGTMRDRFVVCHNPDEAARDEAVRDQLVAQLSDAIVGADTLSNTARATLAAELRAHPGYRRFLRITPGGLLRIDRSAVRAEARLDGKFLLRTSDPTLTAEDVALAYKQLLEVERGWRDMKSTLELRPVYHHLQRRIHAHVLLCWLALLLIRLAETATGDTWRNLRHELDRMHLGRFAGPAGHVLQRTQTTPGQAAIFRAIGVTEPKQFLGIAPAPSA